MNVHRLVICSVLLVIAPSETWASKLKLYNFVEQVMQSDWIVLATGLRSENGGLAMTVQEYVFGRGPAELQVALLAIPPRGRLPDRIDGTRLVFLSSQGGQVTLVGGGTQAIWPQGTGDGITYYPYCEMHRDTQLLATLARKTRFCAAVENVAECEGPVLEMFADPDLFVRLVAVELCLHLNGPDREKYRPLVETGMAFALENLESADPQVSSASLELVRWSPPSVALVALLRLAEKESVEVRLRNAILLTFRQIGEAHGYDAGAAGHCRLDNRIAQAEVTARARVWYEREFLRFLRADHDTIIASLTSESLPRRIAGRLWLREVAQTDFGFDPSASHATRETAISRAEAWWASSRE